MSKENSKYQFLKDVISVDHDDLLFHIETAYDTQTPLFVWGTFGIGKSFMINQFGKKYAEQNKLTFTNNVYDIGPDKFTVGVLAAHQVSAGDVPGLPFPNRETGRTQYLLSELLPMEGQGILFVDELNLASQLVQANLYSLIWDRRAGRYVLPNGWIVMGAGNTTSDRAHIQEMAMPLKNRMGHVQLRVPTAEKWVEDFARKNGIDSRISIFLLFKEDLLYDFNPNDMDERFAVGTPRTWEIASIKIKNKTDPKRVEELVGECVGASAARQFSQYLVMQAKWNTADIFNKKKVPGTFPTDPGEVYALIGAVCDYYAKNKKVEENTETLLDLTYQFKKEHAVIVLKQAASENNAFFTILKKNAKEKLLKATKDYGILL